MKTQVIVKFSLLALIALITGVTGPVNAACLVNDKGAIVQQQKDSITWRVIQRLDNTYGYDIFNNGNLLIHQPAIPGRAGNKGFRTVAEAEKVVLLVVGKIKKGIMPPAVTQQELKELGVADN